MPDPLAIAVAVDLKLMEKAWNATAPRRLAMRRAGGTHGAREWAAKMRRTIIGKPLVEGHIRKPDIAGAPTRTALQEGKVKLKKRPGRLR